MEINYKFMGIIQKVGNFLGVKKFTDSLASTGRVLSGEVNQDIQNQTNADAAMQKLTYAMKNEKDPVKKQKLKEVLQSQLNQKSANANEIDTGINLTPKEIYGSAANVALNVATPGAFKGGTAAVLSKNAALGAGYGLASGLEKNRNTSGIVGSAVGGAAVGAAIGGAGLLAKAAKDFIGKTTPEWIMTKAVKPALQDLKKNVKYGSDTLGKQLLDEGVKGGPKKLLEIADNKTTELENQLQDVLNHPGVSEARITRDKLVPYVKELVEQKAGTPGMSGDVKRIKNLLDSLPESMTLPEANQMKRNIYTELKDMAYKLDAKLGVKAATLKQVARGLKTEIENSVGGTVVKDINQKLSIYGRLENSMVDQLARNMRNNGLGLTDAILIAGGEPTSILALLRHLGQGAETYAAQGLKKVGEVLENPVAQSIKGVIKRGALNLP